MSRATFFTPGVLFIVIAATLWAVDGVLRRNLYGLPPATIVFYEHLLGALVLSPFVVRQLGQEKITARDWSLFGIISLMSGLLGTLWFTTALLKVNFITLGVVFLLQKLQPLFAISSARLLLGEKITKNYIPWAGLALFAAFFVTFPLTENGLGLNLNTGPGTVAAALYALGAAAAWGTGTTFSKMLLNRHSIVVTTGIRMLLTAVFALIAVFVLKHEASLTAVTQPEFTTLATITVSTGMVALYIYYRGLQQVEAKVSTILELTFPVLAVIIDAVHFKSYLVPSQYLAAVVLLFAMYNVSRIQREVV